MTLRKTLAVLVLASFPASPVFADDDAKPSTAAESATSNAPATPPATTAAGTKTEWLFEPDPYYSDIAVHIPLGNKPVPDGGTMHERDVYRTLFNESLHPRLLMIEASVYPLPVLGTWMKKKARGTYDDFTIGNSGDNELNIIEGLTAGFQEPWAISAFVGSEMTFSREGDANRRGNRGYMGYLLSYGSKHIHDNVLIEDNWLEFEWKLKGERVFRDETLSWSFRIGVKEHGNPDIKDVAYFGFRRSNLDFQQPVLQLLTNSTMETLTEFNRHNGQFMRQEIIFGKKVPIRRWHIAPMLETGLIFERADKYTGPLADPTVDDFTIVFRPNIEW